MRSPRKEPNGVTASSFQAQASRQLAPFLCSNRDMSFNSGVPQLAAVHPGHSSGAHDPISIGFYNVGLQSNKETLLWSSPAHCYKFTEALENDLKEAFGPVIGLDALFLCELGSMEKDKSIDKVFSQRTQLHCDVSQPAVLQYCDRVVTLADYLDMMLQRLGMDDFTVSCHPLMRAPYGQKSFGYAANHVEYQFRRRMRKDLYTRTS